MSDKSVNWLKFRIIVIFIGFVLMLLAISVRAYQLQVLQSEELSNQCKKQHNRIIPERAKRGTIYDRNKEEMALSIDVESIYAEPLKVTNKRRYVRELSRILKVSRRELTQKLNKKRSFIWIKRRVSPDQSKKVRDLKLTGIHFINEAKRFYPNREIAGNTMGFVGVDPKGLEGLELQYEDYLKGKAAFSVAEKDALGRTIFRNGLGQREGLAGCDLILTLDKTIQYIAEKELREAVAKTKASSGTVLVMNPRNGELLAIAIQPQFNPNIFWKYAPSAWRNRAVTDSFEPGSTFKVFLLAAALEKNVVRGRDIFFCENGSYHVGRETIHDVHPHGWLSLRKVFKFSSNIGASKIGERLGKKSLYEYIRKFGFGEKTGIDLPGETPGLVRSSRTWSKVAVDTISFGQGLSVSAIQLITGLSAIANKGYLMRPYIVKQIVNSHGKIVKEFKPQIVRRVISGKTAEHVTSILKSAVLHDATGSLASIEGYAVAGKTGTAQKAGAASGGYLKSKYVASFMGFVPADDPEVAILVVIDEPEGIYYGGQIAAPVFKEIARKTLHHMGILPTVVMTQRNYVPTDVAAENYKWKNRRAKSSDCPKKSNNTAQSGKFVMPDFTGVSIRHVLRVMHDSKLDVRIIGSGRAVSQSPKPGRSVKAGQKCWIKFQQPS